jgi:hypothetical protein
MKQIKSHWKLAYRTFKKAIKVTISTLFQVLRANLYSMKVFRHLERQRELFSLIPEEENKFTF